MSKQRPHTVYLLSLWQASTADEPTWRAWLENPCTGQRRGFATLEELMQYLQHEISLLEFATDAPPASVPVRGGARGDRRGTPGTEPARGPRGVRRRGKGEGDDRGALIPDARPARTAPHSSRSHRLCR